ncbi:TolB family protein [Candidatus Omnitrophota bacterium]
MIKTKNTIIILSALLVCICGCSGLTSNAQEQGKIYFTSSIFPQGEEPGENVGLCVLENGKVKKLRRYYWMSKVTRDGKKIAAGIKDETKSIYIVDAITGEKESVAINHYRADLCWFNNDNNKLLYVGYDAYNKTHQMFNIYLVDLTSKEEKQLTNNTKPDNTVFCVSPSPDNSKIVYATRKRDTTHNGRNVKILNLVTKETEYLPFSSTDVTWSHVENKIVLWGVYRDENTKETDPKMYVYDVDSKTYKGYPSEVECFAEDEYTFSPDGQRIVCFRTENNGKKTVLSMKLDRTEQKKLLDWRYKIDDISWTE